MASSAHCRLGRQSTAWARDLADRVAAVGLVGEAEQMRAFGVVELKGPGERVEHARRDPGEGAAFEFRVVLHAHPGQGGDLAAPQTGDAALPGGRQSGLLRGDPGAPRGEELAHLDSVVHAADGTAHRAGERCTASTPILSDFLPSRHAGVLAP